jgi:hypothetical protein
VRHSSGRYYARTFGNNKEIWKSLRAPNIFPLRRRDSPNFCGSTARSRLWQQSFIGRLVKRWRFICVTSMTTGGSSRPRATIRSRCSRCCSKLGPGLAESEVEHDGCARPLDHRRCIAMSNHAISPAGRGEKTAWNLSTRNDPYLRFYGNWYASTRATPVVPPLPRTIAVYELGTSVARIADSASSTGGMAVAMISAS